MLPPSRRQHTAGQACKWTTPPRTSVSCLHCASANDARRWVAVSEAPAMSRSPCMTADRWDHSLLSHNAFTAPAAAQWTP